MLSNMQANNPHQLASGFEAYWFKAVSKLRKNIDASEYKHIALGLIFLKYAADLFARYYAMEVAGRATQDGEIKMKEEFKRRKTCGCPKRAGNFTHQSPSLNS